MQQHCWCLISPLHYAWCHTLRVIAYTHKAVSFVDVLVEIYFIKFQPFAVQCYFDFRTMRSLVWCRDGNSLLAVIQ